MSQSVCIFSGALGVMLLGLAGSFLPLIPGVPLVWLGTLGYGVLDGFNHLSVLAFLVLTALGIVGSLAELGAAQIGARAGGASGWSAATGSCLAWLVMFFFSLPIALLAAVASVFGIELLRASRRSSGWDQNGVKSAARGSGGWLAGWALSSVAQFSISLLMILFFLLVVVF